MLPLADLEVVDLTRLLPGPYATMLLADLGARVLKVEAPFPGDYLRGLPPLVHGMNAAFATLNRNKRSVVVRLETPEGAEVVRRLSARAEVVAESFRPGTMDRFGLSHETLSAENPALVMASLSGYGAAGSHARRGGHDLDFVAVTGLGAALVEADGTPVLPGVQLGDLAGGMNAALGILAAVLEARRTGRGRHLDLALSDGCHALAMLHSAQFLATATAPEPGRSVLTGGNPTYRYYRCRDGRWLAVAALEPRFRARLLAALGLEDPGGPLPGTADEAASPLHARLEEAFARRDRDDWVALLEGVDCCVEPLLEQGEVAGHPLARDRGLVRRALLPHGASLPQPASPLHPAFAPGEVEVGQAAPPPGTHTRQVLLELGYGGDEIAALQAGGCIQCAPPEVSEAWGAV